MAAYDPGVQIVASEPVREYVRERGGRLYIWPRAVRCCRGAFELLDTATEQKADRDFRRVHENGIEVYFPADLKGQPSELHLELRRFPRRRLEAFWDGLAWRM